MTGKWRTLAVLAAVGGLTVACGGGGSDADSNPSGPPAAASDVEITAQDYDDGDCVNWPQEGDSGMQDSEVVSCDEPHLLEVVATIDVGDTFSSYPTDSQWDDFIANDCNSAAEAYLGYELDPYGKFAPGILMPLQDSWAAGDRDVVCGLQLASALAEQPATFEPFTGAVSGQDQTLLYGVGSCATFEAGVVPCDQPHDTEVTGSVDLTGRTETLPASFEEWAALIEADCTAAATAYSGGTIPAGFEWDYLAIPEESWAAGTRVVECAVSQYDAAGQPVPVTGSVKA